ncbi:MAG: hypothetical protein MR419_09555 [Clostridiales bacterium]|nr:hypothetical protein [Clostridiales bacterium]MDY4173261.1 hypothetical protein [Evtepia sp.]
MNEAFITRRGETGDEGISRATVTSARLKTGSSQVSFTNGKATYDKSSKTLSISAYTSTSSINAEVRLEF